MFAAALKASAGLETCSVTAFIRCGWLRFLRRWPARRLAATHISATCTSVSLTVFISSFCLSPPLPRSQEAQAGPASKEYMSQCAGHQPGPAEPQLCLQCQRRQPGWAHTALPELLRSVSPPLPHVSPEFVMCLCSFIATRLYKCGTGESEKRGRSGVRESGSEEWRGGGGDKGAASYNQALFCCAAEANSLFPASVKPYKCPLSASQQCRSIHLPLHPNPWKYVRAPTKQTHLFVVDMKSINVVVLVFVMIQ